MQFNAGQYKRNAKAMQLQCHRNAIQSTATQCNGHECGRTAEQYKRRKGYAATRKQFNRSTAMGKQYKTAQITNNSNAT
eukprot:5780460-Pyramimonas_sp.AAC.1